MTAKKPAKKKVAKRKTPLSALTDKRKNVVSRLEIGATIPTRQYENIQPLIELKDVDLEKGTKIAMDYIGNLAAKYSQHGALELKEINEPAPQGQIAVSRSVKLKSFNEKGVEVDFDPVKHTYFFEGKQLKSATRHTESFYKQFDAEKVGEVCEKAWGIPKQEIIDLWNSNAEIASGFGAIIHKALEHADIHRNNGAKISQVRKDGTNPAILKHPILRRIVEEFQAFYSKEFNITGVIYNEVLITDVKRGFCGRADRLVVDEKKCQIQDFKVNVDADVEDKKLKALKPFDILPATKLTKYRIQMSVYANMLEQSGYEVVGLNAFVLEDTWRHFKLPVLKVLE